jgi:hypothetical protein
MGVRVAILLAFLFCCSVGRAEEVVEIPLNQIWAYNMPSTKKIGELAKQEPRLMEVARSLWKPAPKEESARIAFAVQGTGLDAFRNSYEVLVKKKDPNHNFNANTEISVVFFAHADVWYVHLESVERKNNTITINYKFISHETDDTSEHFALIPLGKLPSGKYQVDMVPNQINEAGDPAMHPVDMEIVNRIVGGSFSFTVKEGK